MRDWIIGLEKAAEDRRSGVADTDWHDAETELQRPAPDELRDLYRSMNGAAFPSGVRLYPLDRRGGGKSILVESRSLDDSWAFGERGDGATLFAIQRGSLSASNPSVPDWVQRLDERQWIYGLRKDEAEVRFYRSLEQLLGVLVPPAQTEEFGDITYARAINALEGALQGLGADSGSGSDDEADNQEADQMDEELEETEETRDDRADDAEEIDDEGPSSQHVGGAVALASAEAENDSEESEDEDGENGELDEVGANGRSASELPAPAPVFTPPPRSLVRTAKDKEPTVGGRTRAAKATKAPKKAKVKKSASRKAPVKAKPARAAKAAKTLKKGKASAKRSARKVKAPARKAARKGKSPLKAKRPAKKAIRKAPAKVKAKKPSRRPRR